jgi:hypothetical protein
MKPRNKDDLQLLLVGCGLLVVQLAAILLVLLLVH